MAKLIFQCLITVCIVPLGICEDNTSDETVDARKKPITYFLTSLGELYAGKYNLSENSATWCVNIKPIIAPRSTTKEICIEAIADFKQLRFEFEATVNGRTVKQFNVDKQEQPDDCIDIPFPWTGPKPCLKIYELKISENGFHVCANLNLYSYRQIELVEIYLPCINNPSKWLKLTEKLLIGGKLY